MCLKFLAAAVVLVVVRSSVHVQAATDIHCDYGDVYHKLLQLNDNIDTFRDNIATADESSMESTTKQELRQLELNLTPPPCNSQDVSEGYREGIKHIAERLRDIKEALQDLKDDLDDEMVLEMEFYKYESEVNQLRDTVQCYLERVEPEWVLPTSMEYTLPSFTNVNEMHYRNKHFAEKLDEFLNDSASKVHTCWADRKKRERATRMERELEKRAREFLLSEPVQGGTSKRAWAPTWQDEPALGGEVYVPETKRGRAIPYGFDYELADPSRNWFDQGLTPQDAPQQVRYSQDDLERVLQVLYGTEEEPKKRSEHVPSWMTYL